MFLSSSMDYCYLCPTIRRHSDEVNKIIKQAKNKEKVSQDFKTKMIAQNMCIADIEARYREDHPRWDQDTECFPSGPLYFDNLANKEPHLKAEDLENLLFQARDMVPIIETQHCCHLAAKF